MRHYVLIVVLATLRLLQEVRKALENLQKYKTRRLTKVTPYLPNFVGSYVYNWGTWPSDISIPEEDKAALQLMLQKEHKIDIPLEYLKEFIDLQIISTQATYFGNSLEHIHPNLMTERNPEVWIRNYIETLGSNTKYLPLLLVLLQQNGISSDANEFHSLYKKIYQEIEQQQKPRRSEPKSKAKKKSYS